MGIFGKLFRGKSQKVKKMYTFFVATDRLREPVSSDIIVNAYRTIAQRRKYFNDVLGQVGERKIQVKSDIAKASSEHFASSFVDWLKSNGVSVDKINMKKPDEKNVLFLVGDADDPVRNISFNWGVFIYLQR